MGCLAFFVVRIFIKSVLLSDESFYLYKKSSKKGLGRKGEGDKKEDVKERVGSEDEKEKGSGRRRNRWYENIQEHIVDINCI